MATGTKDYLFHYAKSVQPLPDFILKVWFESGEIRYYDVKQCFDRWPVFQQLRENPHLFFGVKNEGVGVVFNEDIDLGCNELYWNGKEEKES